METLDLQEVVDFIEESIKIIENNTGASCAYASMLLSLKGNYKVNLERLIYQLNLKHIDSFCMIIYYMKNSNEFYWELMNLLEQCELSKYKKMIEQNEFEREC